MKILFTADCHLDSAFGGEDRLSRNRDLLLNFKSIVDYAKNNDICAVILGGDLFDTPTPSDITAGEVKKIISDSGIPFYAIAGNHDPLDSTAFYSSAPDNMYVFGSDIGCVEIGGTRIYGASVRSRTDTRNIFDSVSVPHGSILVCHGTVNGEGGHFISREAVESSGAVLCLMGHIHKKEEYLWSGPRALYCGAPAGRGFDECGEKGFYVIDTDTKNYTFVKTDAKLYSEYSLDITECTDIVDVITGLSDIRPADNEIARAVLTGEVTGDFYIDCNELCTRTEFFEIKDKTVIAEDVMQNADANTLEGEFIRILTDRLEGAQDRDRQKILDALKVGVSALRCDQ